MKKRDPFHDGTFNFSGVGKHIKGKWKVAALGRSPLSLRLCLYVTIWRLVNRTKLRILADRFGIAKGFAHNIFVKTIKAICSLLKEQVKWPNSVSEQSKIKEEFSNLRSRSFPDVIGCVDGTHIKILPPKQDPHCYYNRKGYHSIILQAVRDSNFKFIDIFFGYSGSCHDANVSKSSPLGKGLESGVIQLIEGSHLLGDSAYPLHSYLIAPFRDNGWLTEEQNRFKGLFQSFVYRNDLVEQK